ncbi:MAG TPA: DUF1800 domain-containing protein [Ktedonobacteraceae bacterium]|nr:DUF1800 domain-containing protein [Ktedonobacteraceae bacterium]
MSIHDDPYNQPTVPWSGQAPSDSLSPTQAVSVSGQVVPPTPVQQSVRATQASQASRARQGQGQMSRRKLLGASLAGLGALGVAGGFGYEWFQHGGLGELFHGSASNAQIGHLLRRAGLGASPSDMQTYTGLGFQGAIDRLLNYQQVPDDDMENRLKALNLDLNKPADQQRWWLLRMAWTQRPLLEKMTLFWHGVLTSSFRKVGGPRVYMRMINQNQFLRAHAFDTFDNILLGITADPAMLFYLDLTRSRKNSPNENYARELMELFTLGLGHYTQQDVSEGAAALTGWHAAGLTSRYLPQDHNDLTKRYLGQTGNFDYKDVVHILANHPATPWFISRKLFTFFVYENPGTDDLKPLVDTYVTSGHNMGAVMHTLLTSPQFSSAKAYRARLKSPTEFVVGAYRALGVQGNGQALPTMTTLMGQTLFDPPNVAGWPGDKVSALWLNSGTWMSRLNYIDLLLVRGSSLGKGQQVQPLDLQSIVNTNHIDSAEHFVDYFASFLLDGTLSSDRHTFLVDYFTTPDTSSYGQKVTLTNGQSYPLNRVRGTLYLMMALPEYQLN